MSRLDLEFKLSLTIFTPSLVWSMLYSSVNIFLAGSHIIGQFRLPGWIIHSNLCRKVTRCICRGSKHKSWCILISKFHHPGQHPACSRIGNILVRYVYVYGLWSRVITWPVNWNLICCYLDWTSDSWNYWQDVYFPRHIALCPNLLILPTIQILQFIFCSSLFTVWSSSLVS